MSISEIRLQHLQKIPVLALRELVGAHLDDLILGPVIRGRFYSVLHCKPRNFRGALQRLTREQLTALIIASPEIGDEEIAQQFEEHRYGLNPSIYIYLFDPLQLNQDLLSGFRECFEQALEIFNATHEEGLHSVRRLALNDLEPLDDRLEVIEASYRFQSRLDFIDENENPVSPYETLYGFFWLNTVDGYVILQARHLDVLKAMKDAIESTAKIRLTALVITKRFKNSLGFLQNEQMCSVRLHDPLPDSRSFRWLSITDDNLYKKDYQTWEGIYPEVRSARYHTQVEGYKETMVTVRCDQGALSLAGAVPASRFRSWCLNSLGEVIRVHQAYKSDAAALVPTLRLASTAEMTRFTGNQKDHILNLITALLMAKSEGGADLQPLSSSPLEIATALGSYVTVQVSLQCHVPGCDFAEELLVACEICGKKDFFLQRSDSIWELVCREHRTKRWTGKIPFELSCPNDHLIELNEETLAEAINVVPGPDLLCTVSIITNSYLKMYSDKYSFDLSNETFLVRGHNLWYFPDRGKAGARVLVIQNIDTVAAGGQVYGVFSG